MNSTDNPFVRLIREGRIKSLQQLRSTYRTLIMKSHPDTVGSDKLIDKYLSFSAFYEEAKRFLEDMDGSPARTPGPTAPNHRLAYYQILQKLEESTSPTVFIATKT